MNILLTDGLWLAAGAGLGAAYFLALRWNAELLSRVGGPPFFALILPFGRFAVIGVCLGLIAMRFGASLLVFTGLGIFMARMVMVRKGEARQ